MSSTIAGPAVPEMHYHRGDGQPGHWNAPPCTCQEWNTEKRPARVTLAQRAESYARDARKFADAVTLGQPITDDDERWRIIYQAVAAELRKVAATS